MEDNYEREGADITAEHMVSSPEEPSEIQKFFSGSRVFLTGATGFLGRIFVEKLLRTCEDLDRIYVLIRPKKGKEASKRLEEIFQGPSFEILQRKNPNFVSKVTAVLGDISEPNLGLSDNDRATLIEKVDVVIHCAATVRFDEKIRSAVNMNVRSVKDLITMAKEMKNLRAMLYISTAFSNCTRRNIDELLYDPPIEPEKILSLCESLDDDKLEKITPILLGDFPNTYVYTKAIAEGVVRNFGKTLPIAVFRPSIVIASVKEPVVGWIDNLYGATGILAGAALGLLRCMKIKKENAAEMIPADYVINGALAAAWDVARVKTINDNSETKEEEKFEKEIPVYNSVSSAEEPITWETFMKLAEKHAKPIPSPLIIWHYILFLTDSPYLHATLVFLLHTIPAYLVDFLAVIFGKMPQMVKGYEKINKFSNVVSYFGVHEWTFTNKNMQALWRRMNKTDKNHFEFSMKNFNWDQYFYTYMRGCRVYLLKDPLDTLPQGKVKYYKLMAAHYALVTLLIFLFYKFVTLVAFRLV